MVPSTYGFIGRLSTLIVYCASSQTHCYPSFYNKIQLYWAAPGKLSVSAACHFCKGLSSPVPTNRKHSAPNAPPSVSPPLPSPGYWAKILDKHIIGQYRSLIHTSVTTTTYWLQVYGAPCSPTLPKLTPHSKKSWLLNRKAAFMFSTCPKVNLVCIYINKNINKQTNTRQRK